MITICSHKTKIENIQKRHPCAIILDITSKAAKDLARLSPFYPYGDIPVPYSDGVYASSVESVWQGLKVFEGEGIDTSVFTNMTMDGIKRTTRKHGSIIGHQRGVFCHDILDYQTAKHLIYIPTYKWMIENKCLDLIAALREISKRDDIILLDYNTCTDVDSKSHPLSHASLVRSYVEGIYPYEDAISEIIENSKINLLQYNLNTNAQLNLFF